MTRPLDFDWGRVGLQICYEVTFPEVTRCSMLDGADLVINCTASICGTERLWDAMVRARAFENAVTFIACSVVGQQTGDQYFGGSVCVDPNGVSISQAHYGTEQLLLIDAPVEAARTARRAMNIVAARRPAVLRAHHTRPTATAAAHQNKGQEYMTDAAALGPLSSMDPFAAERAPGSRPQYADVVRIRSLLEQSRFSAVIAAWPENVGYLSGFYHPDMRVNWERLHLVIWPSGGDPAYVIPRPRADNWNGKTAPPFIGPEESTPVIDDIRGYDGKSSRWSEWPPRSWPTVTWPPPARPGVPHPPGQGRLRAQPNPAGPAAR